MNYNYFPMLPISSLWYYRVNTRNVFGIPIFTFEIEKKLWYQGSVYVDWF